MQTSSYDKYPVLNADGCSGEIYPDLEGITEKLKSEMEKAPEGILVIDGYHGVDFEWLKTNLMEKLPVDSIWNAEDCTKSEEELEAMLAENVTDDRVFGKLSAHTIDAFFDQKKAAAFRSFIEQKPGWKIVYGTGAAHVMPEGLLVYADLTRWEIQQRYRHSVLDNWLTGNYGEDPHRMFKRGYFVEWRVLDRHKVSVFDRAAFFIDTTRTRKPVMIDKQLMEESLDLFAGSPFRLIPYFDEGVWGGTWLKEVCNLPESRYNYAWCFDGVPEENSIAIRKDGAVFEMPAMNLVKMRPAALLGRKVQARFGNEFPIRFDFLDTINGQNLSLQVHPVTEYIQQTFGMHYTQDESYYILDAKDDACVYLGVKDDTSAGTLIPALEEAQKTGEPFEAEKYINRFPVKKHDHLLIPAGTIHCSGRNAMVLEISSTPYIFTFKLYDWGRLGLDGKPRPINIEHGSRNIQYDRTTGWCLENIVSPVKTIRKEERLIEEKTGLHELEFIETRRFWFDHLIELDLNDSVNMLNLVEGTEIRITSQEAAFEPLIIHYAETFILPASLKKCLIEPWGDAKGKTIGLIQAFIRN